MLVVLIRTAWISDDAGITLRCVLNFVHHFFIGFNPGERVQAFTHPLWFILISFFTFIFRNVIWVTFALPILISLLCVWLSLKKISSDAWVGIIVCSILLLSKAFVDYSTSGLENPLSHLILILGFWYGFQFFQTRENKFIHRSLFILSLAPLSRPDLVLVVFPFCALMIYSHHHKYSATAKMLLLVILPTVLWMLFSLFYFGFPLANTAYAKLGTGIPKLELMRQGFVYFKDSFQRDPITLSAILFGVVLGFRDKKLSTISAGVLLYLAYIVSIGGDFMTGRFFTVPLFCATIVIAKTSFKFSQLKKMGVVIGALSIFSIQSTLLSGKNYSDETIPTNGIADERGFYFQKQGLITETDRIFDLPDWKSKSEAYVDVGCGSLGFTGLKRGPNTFLVDICGLADPLLARLPAKYSERWRIGHFYRQVPTNYIETLQVSQNGLGDSKLKPYYDVIRSVVRDPLWDSQRLQKIWALNYGSMAKMDFSYYRDSFVPSQLFSVSRLNQTVETGSFITEPSNSLFLSSVAIKLAQATEVASVDVSLDNSDDYTIGYTSEGKVQVLGKIKSEHSMELSMVRYRIKFSERSPSVHFLVIVADSDNRPHTLGHLHINPQ
jgi:arabinofuranosyltransferase